MKTTLLAAAAALMLGASTVEAATYRVTAIRTGVGLSVAADAPKQALIVYFGNFGVALPAWAAIVTAAQVCRSTHRIVANGVTKFGYDQRTNLNGCP